MKTAFIGALFEHLGAIRERLGDKSRVVVAVAAKGNSARYSIVSRRGGMSPDDITLLRRILGDERPTTESERLLLSSLSTMCEVEGLHVCVEKGVLANLCTLQELHEIAESTDAPQKGFTVENIYLSDL